MRGGAARRGGTFDIPIPRDGGIADLLAQAQRPDRRFDGVICESIDRIARLTYQSTKIEHDLEQLSIPLEKSRNGIEIHTDQGFNVGKPPYGNLARKIKHPVPAMRAAGRHKTKLRRIIADADDRINRYRATLDAGGDPALIAGWISETTSIKKAALARLGLTEAPPQRMTGDQLDAKPVSRLSTIIPLPELVG